MTGTGRRALIPTLISRAAPPSRWNYEYEERVGGIAGFLARSIRCATNMDRLCVGMCVCGY